MSVPPAAPSRDPATPPEAMPGEPTAPRGASSDDGARAPAGETPPTPPGAEPITTQAPDDPRWRDAIVEMRDVSRSFGDVHALKHVSLAVAPGMILGVIGPSGSGKTTAIRLITGALRPDTGRVRVLGEEPRHFHRATRERIGYMPQQHVLYPELTARENIDFIGAMFGMLRPRRLRRTGEVLHLVDLWDARNRRVSQLSGGMQRRVALSCALVHEPSLLILDEPTGGIDPLLRQQIWEELRRLRDSGVTLLVTTQYVGEAEYCDWVALISEGELIAYSSPTELRREALGGEVVQITTTSAFDVAQLPNLPAVTNLRQVGPREFLVIAPDAGEALPDVVDAVTAQGGEVERTREYRPSFDEVFAELVTRHQVHSGMPGGGGMSQGAARFRFGR